MGAESIRVMHPLFQTGEGGSTPTSALQLVVVECSLRLAVQLNHKWHSRVPRIGNADMCNGYAAEHEGVVYAVALWSTPVARMLNGRGMYELRRMAVAPDAPKNTASRFLAVMARLIKAAKTDVATLISYQDTAVHLGTIYKAAGWTCGAASSGGTWSRPSRHRGSPQAGTPKVRWEKKIR